MGTLQSILCPFISAEEDTDNDYTSFSFVAIRSLNAHRILNIISLFSKVFVSDLNSENRNRCTCAVLALPEFGRMVAHLEFTEDFRIGSVELTLNVQRARISKLQYSTEPHLWRRNLPAHFQSARFVLDSFIATKFQARYSKLYSSHSSFSAVVLRDHRWINRCPVYSRYSQISSYIKNFLSLKVRSSIKKKD